MWEFKMFFRVSDTFNAVFSHDKCCLWCSLSTCSTQCILNFQNIKSMFNTRLLCAMLVLCTHVSTKIKLLLFERKTLPQHFQNKWTQNAFYHPILCLLSHNVKSFNLSCLHIHTNLFPSCVAGNFNIFTFLDTLFVWQILKLQNYAFCKSFPHSFWEEHVGWAVVAAQPNMHVWGTSSETQIVCVIYVL